MAQRSGPPPILYILLLLLAAGGYWFFLRKPMTPEATSPHPSTTAPPVSQNLPSAPIPGSNPPATGVEVSFTLPTSVAAGTTIKIDGSTSMVTINQNLKRGFENQFSGTTVATIANGSEKGIQDLIRGNTDLAAVSRVLTPQEQSQGLVAMPVALDAIAIVVGINNPVQGSLTLLQVQDIFSGKIQNWSEVGGSNAAIRVINRPSVSGTHQAFKELVLNGSNFGTTPNIMTLPRDETTGLLRELKNDGIGYATFAQVVRQQTVRVIAINNLTPDAANYPYKRQLYYVYKNPPNQAVRDFLGYVISPQGQQAMFAN